MNPIMVEQYGFLEYIQAIFEVMVLKKVNDMGSCKVNFVWAFGFANTGKSTVAKMLKKIFICDILEEGASHFHV